MSDQGIDIEEVAGYWDSEAREALKVATHLLEKEDYSYALFFGHLAIEKLLKGLYVVKNGEHAPPIHNLLRLVKAAGIKVDDSKTEALITITAFNIESRYPDIKRSFRKKCNREFTTEQMKIIKEIFKWLKSLLT